MFSRRTEVARKYTRTDGCKICNLSFLQIPKGSRSPCANGQSSSISLSSKRGGEGSQQKT